MPESPSAHLDGRVRARTRRRSVLLLSLLGAALTLVALTVFSWSHLERSYYVWTLRRHPELVEPWLRGAKEDRLKAEALRRFFREPEGSRALFELYLAEYDKRQFDPSTLVDTLTRREGTSDHGYTYLSDRKITFGFMLGDRAKQMYSTVNVPTDLEMRRAVLAEMDACVGKIFRTEKLPRHEFYLTPIVDGQSAPPPWRSRPLRGLKKSGARHVLYFRLVDPAGPQ